MYSYSAVAVIYRVSKAGAELLFVKRRENPHDPWSGHIAFPGGRMSKDDKDLLHTAIRETREETGIDLNQSAIFIGKGKPTVSLLNINLLIYPFLFKIVKPIEKLNVPNEEILEAYWIPVSELVVSKSIKFLKPLNDYTSVICYRWTRRKNIVIWGATYRLLRNILSSFKLN